MSVSSCAYSLSEVTEEESRGLRRHFADALSIAVHFLLDPSLVDPL